MCEEMNFSRLEDLSWDMFQGSVVKLGELCLLHLHLLLHIFQNRPCGQSVKSHHGGVTLKKNRTFQKGTKE